LNKVWRADRVGAASAEFIVFPENPDFDSDFLALLLHHIHFVNFARHAVSGDRPRIDVTEMAPYPVAVPPKAEQERIAAEVGKLFDEVEAGEAALKRAREALTSFRASLLHAAVTGQLTEAWRAANPATEDGPALLRRILAERRAAWERTEHARLVARGQPPRGEAWKARYVGPMRPELEGLPVLPSGWAWASVDELTDFRGNGLSRAPDGAPQDMPIRRISAVRPMRVDLQQRRFYVPQPGENLAGATALTGDLLFTRYSGSEQYVGVAGLLRTGGPILYPDKLMCARPAPGVEALGAFLELAVAAGASRKHIAANIRTTAGQKGIAGSSVRACPVPVPPLSEMQEIVRMAGDLLSEGLAVDDEEGQSTALRQSILHAAFTGRLVSQDPADEPASALLARLRATPATTARRTRRRAPEAVSA
jgi:type I restriction enzyme S subunit